VRYGRFRPDLRRADHDHNDWLRGWRAKCSARIEVIVPPMDYGTIMRHCVFGYLSARIVSYEEEVWPNSPSQRRGRIPLALSTRDVSAL